MAVAFIRERNSKGHIYFIFWNRTLGHSTIKPDVKLYLIRKLCVFISLPFWCNLPGTHGVGTLACKDSNAITKVNVFVPGDWSYQLGFQVSREPVGVGLTSVFHFLEEGGHVGG